MRKNYIILYDVSESRIVLHDCHFFNSQVTILLDIWFLCLGFETFGRIGAFPQ